MRSARRVRARCRKNNPLTTTFNDLGLNAELLQALATEGYTKPTPIQAQAIPSLLQGRDLLGIAQTGTGKTAAFALPILQRLAAEKRPTPRRGARCLVLSPTRELATQIADSFKAYGRHTGFSVITVFGGVGHRPQALALQRGVDVVVATPGRLIDHMNERNIDLSQTEILVLDEADQMMDLGFIKPLRQIISKLSMKRQSMFFSATMPQEIGALAAELLRDPVKVSVTPVAKTADRVAQKVIHVEQSKKKSMLVELFGDASMTRTLVFTRTKRGADRVARHLETHGIQVAAIHGNKSQNQREAALAAFKAGKIRGLVATDIAARGIDVDEVSHVVNFEIPNIPESYVHRIGRTARAGAEGIAISLVDGEERAYLRDIEKLTRQQIPSEDRRNDASLAVEEKVRGGARPEHGRSDRGERNGRRGEGERHARGGGSRQGRPGRSEPHRGERSGEGERHASPRHAEARGERAHRDGGRVEGQRGEARGEGRSEQRPRHEGGRHEGSRHEASRGGRPERPQHERKSHDAPRQQGQRHNERRGGQSEYVNELAFGAPPQRPDSVRKRNFDDNAANSGDRSRPGRGHGERSHGEHGRDARPARDGRPGHHGAGHGRGGQHRDGGRPAGKHGSGHGGGHGGGQGRPRHEGGRDRHSR